MNTKHTPGPWASATICKFSGWVDINGEHRGGTPLAYATPKRPGTPEERGDDETVANARLIAAAPDLWGALDKLLSWGCLRSDWMAAGKAEPADHPLQIARAAIAAATGEAP